MPGRYFTGLLLCVPTAIALLHPSQKYVYCTTGVVADRQRNSCKTPSGKDEPQQKFCPSSFSRFVLRRLAAFFSPTSTLCALLWRLVEKNVASTPPGCSARVRSGTRPAGAAGLGPFAFCHGGISIGGGCEGQGRAGRAVQGVPGAPFSAVCQGALSHPTNKLSSC